MEVTFDSIRIIQAENADVNSVMLFIGNEWKNDHILSRNKHFFHYEHVLNNKVNFIIALNRNREIVGVLGFLPYAPTTDGKKDIATVIWKVSEKCKVPAIGLRLLDFLLKLDWVRTVFSVGINNKTIGIYKYLGMFTGTMDQFVILNSQMRHDDFRIAKVSSTVIVATDLLKNNYYSLSRNLDSTEASTFPYEKFINQIPYKNFEYVKKRYFDHPIYKYEICGIRKGGELVAQAVFRIQEYKGDKAMRMVDYFGDTVHLSNVVHLFRQIINENGFEYLDFYCFGFSSATLEDSGFLKLKENDDSIIIPNYFAPYVQNNVTINFFINTHKLDLIRLCKADGDQDRPS